MKHSQVFIFSSVIAIALVAAPSNAAAQEVGNCDICVGADFSFFSHPEECEGSHSGAEHCMQPEEGVCDTFGDRCESDARYVLASGRVVMPGSQAQRKVVRRSCDDAIAHRTYTEEGVRRIMDRLKAIELALE